MPEPNYTDRELFERAGELFNAYLEAYAAERGRSLTGNEVSLREKGTTIAVTEVLVEGSYTYIVTTNASEAYNVLNRNRRLLRPFEVLGDPNTNVYLRWTPEEKQEYFNLKGTKPPRQFTIHAEQLGAMSGRALGGSVLRIGVSRNICEVCIEFFRERFWRTRLIDPSTRTPPQTPNETEGPSTVPRSSGNTTNTFSAGQRATAASVVIIQGATFAIERYVAHREAARVQEAIRAKEYYLKDYQNKNPSVGILIKIYFDHELFVPPLEFSYGSTKREAITAAQPTVRPESSEISVAWLPPHDPPSFSYYQPPFPRVALATFSGVMVFQGVKFSAALGFDDQGESIPPPSPPGFAARFWILETPTQVIYFWNNRYNVKDVDTTIRRLASGQPVQCIDLDSTWLSVGNDSAFMAFPADEATAQFFQRVSGASDPLRQLRRYELEFVRWVSPGKAKLLSLTQ